MSKGSRGHASIIVVTLILGIVTSTGCAGPAAPGGVLDADWPNAMLNRVNAERRAAAVPELVLCRTLLNSAQGHSEGQVALGRLSHIGLDGSRLADRVMRAGYLGWTKLGENVAYGQPTIDATVMGWMRSRIHRVQLVDPSYTHVGFGAADDASGRRYWTQDFGRNGAC